MFVLAVAFVFSVTSAGAASDYYLKIGDIKGESTDTKGEASMEFHIQAVRVGSETEIEIANEMEEEHSEDESENDDSMKEERFEQDGMMKGDDDSDSADDATMEDEDDDDGQTLRGVYIKLGDIKGESSGSGNMNATFFSDSEIRVSGVEVRGWDPVLKESVRGAASGVPETTEELAVLAASAVSEDENLESVSLNFEKITWEYKSYGKLLGFIPVSFTKTITVSTDPETTGEVKVKFPWYRFLTRVDVSGKELGQEISSAFKGEGIAGLNPEHEPPTIETRARIFTTISNVLKARHEAAMGSIRNIK